MTRAGRGADAAQLALFDAVAPTSTAPIVAVPPQLPESFRHPRADREIRLREHVVAYSLKRVRRRSIGFMVGSDGLSVNVPKWIGVRDIEAALHEKTDWILRKLAEQRERSLRLAAARIDWRDGTTIPFLGEPIVVAVDPPTRSLREPAPLDRDGVAPVLRLALPAGASAAQLRDAVQRWLKREARRVFEARCRVFAARMGVTVTHLSLSSARTRWGSASADGSIRLNWRLVHFEPSLIDYVVVHELAHLREMNHSPRFWNVVRETLPGFERARDALKAGAVPMFD